MSDDQICTTGVIQINRDNFWATSVDSGKFKAECTLYMVVMNECTLRINLSIQRQKRIRRFKNQISEASEAHVNYEGLYAKI